jgi:transcriptional regulator with XRE-family HTH domain
MTRRTNHDPTIGQRIKTRRKLRGWSVRYAADRAGISHSTLSRIERGESAADNRFLLADIAAALECQVADLTGSPVTPQDPQTVAAQASVAGLRLALLETDLEEDATVAPPPSAEVEREAQLVHELRTRTDYTGVGVGLPDLLRQAHALAVGADREPGLRLLVSAAYDAASTLRDLGHPADAWLAAERSRQAAEALDDPVSLAVAGFCRAHSATACGTYARGLRIAGRAADALHPHLSHPGALPMLGLLQLTAAYASRALHRRDDSMGWLGEAAEVADRTGETDVFNFGPANVRIWHLSMEADGGDPGRAVEIAHGTNPSAVQAVSRQVTFHVDTARALARLRGRDEGALRHLLTAERMGPQMVRSSALVRETARALLERAQRDAVGAQLRGLCERIGVPQ